MIRALPALADHLCQSTLFAAAAALAAFAFRRDPARARHRLWMAASLKFLVPFSLLVRAGGLLAFPWSSAAPGNRWYELLDTFSRPFSRPGAAAAALLSPTAFGTLASLAAATWACGIAAVAGTSLLRWRRASDAIQSAPALAGGREVNVLRRAKRLGGIRGSVAIRCSSAFREPAVFGIVRPVLVWPRGISEHLSDAHLEAIVAHEVWHLRRRDNLASALHMAVEAIFWFHPLVWWIGGRLLEERELACDEEVLSSGREPQTYAESILKACEFGVGLPMPCASGVAGTSLERRIVRIVAGAPARPLRSVKRVMLAAAALAVVATPILFGSFVPCAAAEAKWLASHVERSLR